MNVIDKWSQENGGVRATERAMERARTAELAHHLSTVALRQWEKALTGIVAFPSAAALGIAATATYGVAMLERGFEVFEAAIGEIGRTIAHDDVLNRERRERTPERSEARS
jgi:hypothetical protein